jgi:hypothetical protein
VDIFELAGDQDAWREILKSFTTFANPFKPKLYDTIPFPRLY